MFMCTQIEKNKVYESVRKREKKISPLAARVKLFS